jgi:hypothetical protein
MLSCGPVAHGENSDGEVGRTGESGRGLFYFTESRTPAPALFHQPTPALQGCLQTLLLTKVGCSWCHLNGDWCLCDSLSSLSLWKMGRKDFGTKLL